MYSLLLCGFPENDEKQLERMLSAHDYRSVCCGFSSVQSVAEEYQAVLFNASACWPDMYGALDFFSQHNSVLLFLTPKNPAVPYIEALYPGKCMNLQIPFSDDQLYKAIGVLMQTYPAVSSLSIDADNKTVILNGEIIPMTHQEIALLRVLLNSPDHTASRRQLLISAWGYQCIGETRTVDVHVQRIRKKLGADSIETIYRYGYRLNIHPDNSL